jgi:hypothetical protein
MNYLRIVLLALTLFTSCMSQKQLALRCQEKFPTTFTDSVLIVTQTVYDTSYAVKTVTIIDSITIEHADTIALAQNHSEWVFEKAKVEISKGVPKKVICNCSDKIITRINYFEDSTKLFLLHGLLNTANQSADSNNLLAVQYKTERDVAKYKNKTYFWIMLCSILAFFLACIVAFFKK